MPRVTLWVKKKDYKRYKAIVDRVGWLHDSIRAYRPPAKPIPGLEQSKNIKQNSDGTLSPIDPNKPTSFTSTPTSPAIPEHTVVEPNVVHEVPPTPEPKHIESEYYEDLGI